MTIKLDLVWIVSILWWLLLFLVPPIVMNKEDKGWYVWLFMVGIFGLIGAHVVMEVLWKSLA